MFQCMLCGRTVSYPLQGYAVFGLNDVVYKCLDCPVPARARAVPVAYVHARFCPGMTVCIDPRIREVHPLSPLAGCRVHVCEGSYYPLLEAYGELSHEHLVPVKDVTGKLWFVEEQYVCVG